MKINQKIKKIFFFDTLSDVNEYLNNNVEIEEKKTNMSDCLFIAMKPSAYPYLKQRKLLVQNSLPYFTNDSHERVLVKSKILIDWLRENTDFVDLGNGIQYAYREAFIYWTRLAIHYCLWVIEIVSNAINIHQPEVLSAPLSDKKFVSSLLIEPEERYLGYIVKIIARERNLKYENASIDTFRNYNLLLSQWKNYMYCIVKFFLKYGRFQLWEKMISVRGMFTKNRPVFFTTRFYQMDKLAKEIQAQRPDKQFYFLQQPATCPVRIPDFFIKLFRRRYSKIIMAQKRSCNNLKIAIKEEADFFSYRGISFGNIISQKIEDNIAAYILGLMLWTPKINQFINASKASAFISNGNRADDMILAELCQRKGIPTILVSHGSHTRPKNEYENIEWGEHGRAFLRAPFSFLALQSPLAEGYLEVFPSPSKTIKTGPLIWGKPVKLAESRLLFKEMFNGKYDFEKIKIVLHAGTSKRGKALRPYVYETPDEYIRALCELAYAIEKISNAVLIIKFRPQSEISVSDLKSFVPFSDKVLLSVDEPFLDVLGMSNLLVSFSSTTIEEALQNKIPVLLYGGGGRYQHIPAYEIKSDNSVRPSAVYHVKEAQDLENAIREILNLDIDITKVEDLFAPYIYTQDIRTSLADLLKVFTDKEERQLY